MGMNWLITGGCGFIGVNLIETLLASGQSNVRIVDNLSAGDTSRLEAICELVEVQEADLSESFSGVQLVVADILDSQTAISAGKGVDVVVHLAANTGVPQSVADPVSDCKPNVMGTLNYLESSRVNGIRKFIFASSGAPVGNATPPIHEDIVPHPVSPYGASKLAGEAYCSAYYHCFGIESVALRFSNVYGPRSGHKGSVVAAFFVKAMGGQPVTVYGDGSQTRDFIFVADLVDAVLKSAFKSGVGGEVFQISTGIETSVNSLIQVMNQVFREASLDPVIVQYEGVRAGDVLVNYSDASKAKRELNWEAVTKLSAGLKLTVADFSKRGI